MHFRPNLILVVLLVTFYGLPDAYAQEKGEDSLGRPVLWRDPGPIKNRDLRYGPGSAGRAPAAPFTFLKEDKDGESPKFDVKDARGVHWSVKHKPKPYRRAWSPL
jgi:hypothetical protein